MDFGNHVVIIEIDENQHSDYDCTCENKRLMELFQDCGNRPLTMIRFNPDDYINFEGDCISSCWEYTKKGLCTVKNKKRKDWEERLNVLKMNLETIIKEGNEREINVIHLYYDGFM